LAETVAAPPRPSTLDALQIPDFRFLWLNGLTFFIARGMQMVSVSWLVLDLTDSPALVGVVLFVQGAPMALFSVPAGIWADRLDRRALLLASQTAAASATAALAALVLADVITTWSVFMLAFLMGSAQALGQPSRQALVPSLVGPARLMNAIVLNTLVQNVSFVIGPAVAGGLLAGVGFGGTFLAQVALLALGLPWLLALRAPPVERRPDEQHGLAAIREGLRHVAESPFIRSLFVVTAFTGIFFVGTYQALLPVFADDVLHVGEVQFGLLNAAFGLGMFAGSLYIASRGDLPRKGEVLLRSLLVGSVVLAAFALSRWFPLSLALMLAWGAGAAFFMNLTTTLIQSHTPDRLMGRVMAVQALAFFGVSPLGNLEAGLVADLVSPQAAAMVGAVGVALLVVFFLLRAPELRAAE
jgi:MFS family permease